MTRRLRSEAAALSESPYCGLYHDRITSPRETVERVRRSFPALGITRVARVTGLDRIGIPVFLAVRPNSRTLAVTQGKGTDDDAARASAVMESAEQAIAERPRADAAMASLADLAAMQQPFVTPLRFLRRGRQAPSPTAPLPWLEGIDLLTGATAWAPRDVVRLDFTEEDSSSHPFWQSSDGLAAGNVFLEAVLHGLLERVERDAAALWSFRSAEQVQARCLDPASFGDPVVSDLATRVDNAGLRLRLFDITSDICVPTIFAVIAEPHPTGLDWRHFDLCRGIGCHPLAVRAAIRAITEAAQSRLTAISGARDDFDPETYDATLRPDLHLFRLAEPRVDAALPKDAPAVSGGGLSFILERLRACGVRSAVAVPLGGEDLGVSVAKVLVPDLEDPPESRHRQLGRRALNVMLGAA